MKSLFILFIKIYQKLISPLFPNKCRFIPSCSHYAIEAINKYGVCKGSILALKRILNVILLILGDMIRCLSRLNNDLIINISLYKLIKRGNSFVRCNCEAAWIIA